MHGRTVIPSPPPSVFTLNAANGVTVRLTDLGATLMRIDAPDRAGHFGNILLSYDDPADYPAAGAPGGDAYLGATCGRFANRIAGAAFDIDGTHYPLAANEGSNQLHGGPRNFHHERWQTLQVDDHRVVLRHHSPDGDQGFPGALDATADFGLSDDGELTIIYTATTSRSTHVNLVSHGYFNLSGERGTTILDHRLWIDGTHYLPIDAAAIPLGYRRSVAGTAFDFTRPRIIGDKIGAPDAQLRLGGGYNHCYTLSGDGVHDVAMLDHPKSGRTLTIATDQPGLQLYTGNDLGDPWPRYAGVCLETQHWPDSPNRPDFPSTRLDPGATYRSETRLRPGVSADS
jgi:aldose 1-epimerase